MAAPSTENTEITANTDTQEGVALLTALRNTAAAEHRISTDELEIVDALLDSLRD